MNVLSLFDGISAAQLALKRANIKVDNYFSSEIDKYAIEITQNNFPNTIQLGDITKWKSWNLAKIDLIIGGSPCQGFSFAGKGLNFNDERSKLFFHFVDTIKKYNPKYFLLENVRMKKEYSSKISELLNVDYVEINSNLVSAQNRVRLYWTNLRILEPNDEKIYLENIIKNGTCDRRKNYCIDANYYKGTNLDQYKNKCRRQIIYIKNSHFINREKKYFSPRSFSGKNTKKERSRATRKLVERTDNKCNSLSVKLNEQHIIHDSIDYRILTPIECERLQTFPDNYTVGVSKTQRYKALGNSFTVDVIVHILKGIQQRKTTEKQQVFSFV